MNSSSPSDSDTAAYDHDFFCGLSEAAEASARAVVPVLLRMLEPRSVLDVGCGSGEWLAMFLRHGVTDVQGIDAFAPAATRLRVPQSCVTSLNLEEPFNLRRRFDLVLCLEVAEHLSPSAGGRLIRSLTAHGDVVVFSAAIPRQGGRGHVNEQWLEYWVDLFRGQGFRAYDALRPVFWRRSDVAAYYRQNMVIFAAGNAAVKLTAAPTADSMHSGARSFVHPETFRNQLIACESPNGLRYALRTLYVEIGCKLGIVAPRSRHFPEYPSAAEAPRKRDGKPGEAEATQGGGLPGG